MFAVPFRSFSEGGLGIIYCILKAEGYTISVGSIFSEITIVILLAALITIIFRFFKQPPILAYILTGIIIGPFGHIQLQNQDGLHALAQIGITLLLFTLGLELKLKDLRSIGGAAIGIGISQILLTGLAGYSLGTVLGFSSLSSLYIAIALTFSSTIIIVKLLSDRRDLNSLYGKISVGILIVQDLVAVFILMFLSVFNSQAQSAISPEAVGNVVMKAVILFAVILYLSSAIFPRLVEMIARSQETLFLFSLAWVFGLSAFVSSSFIGFPIEIGGFLAGLALANSSENFQIVARVRSLRDFFITIFFVVLGMEMQFSSVSSLLIPLIAILGFIIILKPLIIIAVMGLWGYRKRTSFLTGIGMAQISEFSLIILFLGSSIGHIGRETVSVLTLAGIITFVSSTYMILGSNTIYRVFSPLLGFIEKKDTREKKQDSSDEVLSKLNNHVVLVGVNRMGKSVLEALAEEKEKMVAVDFDPDVVRELNQKGVLSVFGDIADMDIQERVGLKKAKLIISTVPDVEDNLILLQSLNHSKDGKKVIVIAQDAKEAKELYKAGAHYVVLPHLAGGRHLAKIIKDDNLDHLEVLKSLDLAVL